MFKIPLRHSGIRSQSILTSFVGDIEGVEVGPVEGILEGDFDGLCETDEIR